jgi:muramoyltetrapeptide carboxypeptidase
MITPSYLKRGDIIAIVAPARKIEKEIIYYAKRLIEAEGYRVILSDNLFGESNQYSGTVEERVRDMQTMLDNESVSAIFCARGGYGTIQLLQDLNWNKFIKKPKWIVGYSDISVLHCFINKNFDIQTLHATMPVNFQKALPETLNSLFDILSGKNIHYNIPKKAININGYANGELIGGNLSILYSLNGTPAFPDLKNKILFIEDLDEYLYHIDRMMMNLDYSGVFSDIKGLIVGGMNDMNDNTIPFGMTAEQIIFNVIEKYNIPVCFGFDAGHIEPNLALAFGKQVRLLVSDRGAEVSYE